MRDRQCRLGLSLSRPIAACHAMMVQQRLTVWAWRIVDDFDRLQIETLQKLRSDHHVRHVQIERSNGARRAVGIVHSPAFTSATAAIKPIVKLRPTGDRAAFWSGDADTDGKPFFVDSGLASAVCWAHTRNENYCGTSVKCIVALFTAKHKAAHEALHPETAHGGDRASRKVCDLNEEGDDAERSDKITEGALFLTGSALSTARQRRRRSLG